MFWFLIVTVATAAWCAGATSFESFMAARILNGFFSTLAQIGGLMFIQDMFFFHERARKINIWASFFVISPYMGPLLAAFMLTTKRWPVPFWVYTALTAASFVLVTLFLRETYYDRRIPQSEQPSLGSRAAQLTGVAQFRSRHLRNTFGQAVWRTVSVVLKPNIFLTCFYYVLVSSNPSWRVTYIPIIHLTCRSAADLRLGRRHQHDARHLLDPEVRL